MDADTIGYYEHPPNDKNILRARTTMQVRSWQIPRREKTLQALRAELETVEYPGIYILFQRKTKVYVGEAQNIYTRLDMKNPEDKIKDWDQALIISDGRPATQSDFNDAVIRLALEAYTAKLLKTNNYTVVSTSRTTQLNQTQRHTVNTLVPELNFFLEKKGIITRLLEEPGQEQVYLDELIDLFQEKRISIQKWSEKEAIFEREKVFIRPGSKKPKGWQITIRGRKPGSFIDCARRGKGYLLVPRDGVLFIPLTEVKRVIPESVFEHDTVDIWIIFTPEKTTLSYKKNVLDVTDFKLLP